MKSLVVRSVFASLATVLAVASCCTIAAGGGEPKREDLRPFMRQKLKHAQFLIEGLANEDFDLIRDNARALRKVGQNALWKVSPNLASSSTARNSRASPTNSRRKLPAGLVPAVRAAFGRRAHRRS